MASSSLAPSFILVKIPSCVIVSAAVTSCCLETHLLWITSGCCVTAPSDFVVIRKCSRSCYFSPEVSRSQVGEKSYFFLFYRIKTPLSPMNGHYVNTERTHNLNLDFNLFENYIHSSSKSKFSFQI